MLKLRLGAMPESMMATPIFEPFGVDEVATFGNPSVSRNVLGGDAGTDVSAAGSGPFLFARFC